MDFSGFVMLVMGFNGAKADAVKEAYINAFNWMSADSVSTAKVMKQNATP